eukprot:1011836-Amphidinium_carterae.1
MDSVVSCETRETIKWHGSQGWNAEGICQLTRSSKSASLGVRSLLAAGRNYKGWRSARMKWDP